MTHISQDAKKKSPRHDPTTSSKRFRSLRSLHPNCPTLRFGQIRIAEAVSCKVESDTTKLKIKA